MDLLEDAGSATCSKKGEPEPRGFEKVIVHKTKKHPFGCLFDFIRKPKGTRTREGMSVIRMSCEHSNSEWSEGDRNV